MNDEAAFARVTGIQVNEAFVDSYSLTPRGKR